MQRLEDLFKALADGTRLRIMSILLEQELCVCEIVETLNLPQSRVSRHLGILKDAGWVVDRREAQMVYYRLNSENSAVSRLALNLSELLNHQPAQADRDNLKRVLAGRANNVCCPNEPRSGCCSGEE